ncbi:hypothetical protein HYR54_02005 [Candidatus Acetothermia bacterium]|nr:hypothetical protein [Candidatus Acetothermia bacterium]
MRTQLENRGLSINSDEAIVVHVSGSDQAMIPFGTQAHLIWTRAQDKTAALGIIQQGQKTLDLTASGAEQIVRVLKGKELTKLLKHLESKGKFKKFEKQLRDKGKKLVEERLHMLLDETQDTATLALTTEDSASGQFTHVLHLKLKHGKDDELQSGEDPDVQEIACSGSTAQTDKLKVTPTSGSRSIPMFIDGDPTPGGAYDSTSLCTSSWGYQYYLLQHDAAVQCCFFWFPGGL